MTYKCILAKYKFNKILITYKCEILLNINHSQCKPEFTQA